MEINILKVKFLSSHIHSNNDFVGKGSHSEIYQMKYENNKYALKSISINPTSYKDDICEFSEIKYIL